MPKKTKARKNTKNTFTPKKYTLLLKTDGQEYAKIVRILGSCRYECECFDNKTRLCIMRGGIRKFTRKKIKTDCIVLLSLRDFQDDKADILHLYSNEDTEQLIKLCEIPAVKINYDIAFDTIDILEEDEDEEIKINFEEI
jgi:translation initiation factor 1A